MEKLTCFVLMPFSKHRSFIYHDAIKKAVYEINDEILDKEYYLELELERADEIPAGKQDKVSQIKGLIDRSDILIVDISGANPNVYWELGYSTAKGKNIVVLSEKIDRLPFNIRLTDVCYYEFSYEGIIELRKKVKARIEKAIPKAKNEKESLINHEAFSQASRKVIRTLKMIREDSILKRLALNELTRIGNRFGELRNGLFILRNGKPNDEIIEYYCDYLLQLDGPDCAFETVSNLNFWREITANGSDPSYVNANVRAALSGANIRRLILVDGQVFSSQSVKESVPYSKIMSLYYNNTNDLGNGIRTNIYFSPNYEAERKLFENFGILRKASEVLLFKPRYEGNNMKNTEFSYCNLDNRDKHPFDRYYSLIQDYSSKFARAWEKGEPLSEKHFA